jgi:cytochrome c oxidase subunit IV
MGYWIARVYRRRRVLKKVISQAICIKNIVIWAVVTSCCFVAIGTFIKSLFEDLSAGKEIFLPGVLVLVFAVLCVLVFSITRIRKHIKLLKFALR